MSNNVGKDLVLQVDGFGGVISLNVNNGEIEGVYGRDPTAASSSYSITVGKSICSLCYVEQY